MKTKTKILPPLPKLEVKSHFMAISDHEMVGNLERISLLMSSTAASMLAYCNRTEWSAAKHKELIQHAHEMSQAAVVVDRWAREIAKDK